MRMTYTGHNGATIELGATPTGVMITATDGTEWGSGTVPPERARDIAQGLLKLADHTQKRGGHSMSGPFRQHGVTIGGTRYKVNDDGKFVPIQEETPAKDDENGQNGNNTPQEDK